MPNDDNAIIDSLLDFSTEIKRYTADIADVADQKFDAVAAQLRELLARIQWLPGVSQSSASQSPSTRSQLPPAAANGKGAWRLSSYGGMRGLLQLVNVWVSEHRAISAAILAFAGTTAVLVCGPMVGFDLGLGIVGGKRRKRKARRAANGARTEVVVIIGPPTAPLTRSLALDLERRGFMVYVVVHAVEDEQIIHNESRIDIRPLLLDVGNPSSTAEAMKRFHHLLSTPHQAVTGATANKLHFAGLILAPELTYPSGPIATLSMDTWSDTVNARILGTIATVQEFLPLIHHFRPGTGVIMLTSNNISSIRPPFHSPESTVVGALTGFFSTLQHELDTIGVSTCHFKLGAFDFGGVENERYPRQHQHQRRHNQKTDAQAKTGQRTSQASSSHPGADTLSWPSASSSSSSSPSPSSPSPRTLYARNYLAQLQTAGLLMSNRDSSIRPGAPLRELHHALFDALTQQQQQRQKRALRMVRHVGRGSFAYEMVGRFVPRGVVAWMLGLKSVDVSVGERGGKQVPAEKQTGGKETGPNEEDVGGEDGDERKDGGSGGSGSGSGSRLGMSRWEEV